MHKKALVNTRRFLTEAEEFLEDFVILILGICVILVLIASIGTILGYPSFASVSKLKEVSILLFPWVAMLAGMLIFRELWLLRRSIERIEIRKLIEFLSSFEEEYENKKRRGRKK